MDLTNITSNITFTVEIQGCNEVEIVRLGKEPKDIFLKWYSASNRTDLKKNQLNRFLEDTQVLIKLFGDNYYDKGFYIYDKLGRARPSGVIPGAELLTDYWSKWGPLYPTEEEKVTLDELISICWVAYSLELTWRAIDEDKEALGFVNRFFVSISEARSKDSTDQEEGHEPASFWRAVTMHERSRFNLFFWAPLMVRPSFADGVPRELFFPNPTHFNNDDDDWNERREFFRRAVLEYMAYFISQQQIQFKLTIDGGELALSGGVSNAICAYLMFKFIGKKQQHLKYCKCGCLRIVTGKKRVYATDECRVKDKQQNVRRRVKSWLRMKKSREKFPDEVYRKLCSRINDLDDDGLSEGKIKELIGIELKQEKKAFQVF